MGSVLSPAIEPTTTHNFNLSRPPAQIPTTLYGLVIQNIDSNHDLPLCLRVCREFHYHAVRRLYNTMYISSILGPLISLNLVQNGPSSHAAITGTSSSEPLTPATGLTSPSLSPVLDPPSDHPSYYRADREALLSHLARYTKHLIADCTGWRSCQPLPPLKLPHLVSLRIPARHNSAHKSQTPLDMRCPLLRNLKPRILYPSFGARAGVADIDHGLGTVWREKWRPQIPHWIKEIIITVNGSELPNETDPATRRLDALPDTVERLRLVVAHPPPRGMSGTAGPSSQWPLLPPPPPSVRLRLARACIGRAKLVEIQGLETMYDIFNEKRLARVREEKKTELRRLLLERGWTDVAAEARVEGVVLSPADEESAAAQEEIDTVRPLSDRGRKKAAAEAIVESVVISPADEE